MRTTIASAGRVKQRAVIATPPLFAIFCLLIWTAALVIVFLHQGDIDTLPFIGP